MGEVYGANAEKGRAQGLSQDNDGSAVAMIGTKVTLGIEYHGELRDGKREGFGTQRWPNGCHYEGYFHNDVRHGQGKHWWTNGEVRRSPCSMSCRNSVCCSVTAVNGQNACSTGPSTAGLAQRLCDRVLTNALLSTLTSAVKRPDALTWCAGPVLPP